MNKTVNNEVLEPLIFIVRGRRVVLDADLARLYGVSTKRFNEAFKRNRRRFPEGFAFQLSAAEFDSLRAKFAPPSMQVSDSSRGNWSQFATSPTRGHLKRLAEIDQTLLQPPADPPKRRIGFHADTD